MQYVITRRRNEREMDKNLKETMTEDFSNLRREMDINY